MPDEPSSYIQTLTTYLSNIMSSTLLGLPRAIKELIYFDALSHAASNILVSPDTIHGLFKRTTMLIAMVCCEVPSAVCRCEAYHSMRSRSIG